MKYAGLYTAIVTPFRDGKVDYDALQRLIEGQIAGGVTGIVPVGTTGESPTLSHSEHNEVIAKAIEFANKRCQVIAGTGSNCTEEAISLTREAEKMGADGTLQVCPYYNKPSQEGLYHHFKAVAESTSLPVLLYSIPGRSGIEIAVDTVARLAQDCPTIVAIKEAGGSVERVNQLVHALPADFSVLSGDDGLTVPFISCGAVGAVSVTSNVAPAAMVELVNAAMSGDGKLVLAKTVTGTALTVVGGDMEVSGVMTGVDLTVAPYENASCAIVQTGTLDLGGLASWTLTESADASYAIDGGTLKLPAARDWGKAAVSLMAPTLVLADGASFALDETFAAMLSDATLEIGSTSTVTLDYAGLAAVKAMTRGTRPVVKGTYKAGDLKGHILGSGQLEVLTGEPLGVMIIVR